MPLKCLLLMVGAKRKSCSMLWRINFQVRRKFFFIFLSICSSGVLFVTVLVADCGCVAVVEMCFPTNVVETSLSLSVSEDGQSMIVQGKLALFRWAEMEEAKTAELDESLKLLGHAGGEGLRRRRDLCVDQNDHKWRVEIAFSRALQGTETWKTIVTTRGGRCFLVPLKPPVEADDSGPLKRLKIEPE
jgi:hypothetical protein